MIPKYIYPVHIVVVAVEFTPTMRGRTQTLTVGVPPQLRTLGSLTRLQVYSDLTFLRSSNS